VKPKRRFQIAIPALYIAFAIYGWVEFINTNHDGLANIGLFLITAPVTIIGLIVGGLLGHSSMPMPHGFGYVGDHALYYFPAVAITAAVWWFIGRGLDRMAAGKPPA